MKGPGPPLIYEFGDFQLDPSQRLLRGKDGRLIPLTARVFDTLRYLVEHAGQLIEKSTLLEAVWPRVIVEEGSLSQAVYELRRALGQRQDEHRYIVTVPGRGYQFVAEVIRRERTVGGAAGAPSDGIVPAAVERDRGLSDASVETPLLQEAVTARTFKEAPTRAVRAIPRKNALYVAAAILLAIAVAWYGARSLLPASVESKVPAAQTVATVAVLPFADLSAQQDQQYFSEGLSEELIHLLAQNPALRVIARTSSFSFKSRDVDVPTIAAKLGASHVLEGSVRKSGNRIRIAVQLVDGATSAHFWSQAYDREIEDAITVQQDIAASIATALNATLQGRPLAAATTPAAYDHFLRARFLSGRRQPGDIALAEQAYRRAVEVDPAFARAWAGLAGVYFIAADADDLLGLSHAEAMARMRDATERALQLAPNLAEAHVRRAMYRFVAGDSDGAREAFERAAFLEPTNPLVLGGLASTAVDEGHPGKAADLVRRVVQDDPLSLPARATLGAYLYYAGRFDEAEAEFRALLPLLGPPTAALEGLADNVAMDLAKVLAAQQRFDEALSLVRTWPEGQYRSQCLALIYFAVGRARESDTELERLLSSPRTEPHWIAEVYAQRHDADRAFRWLGAAAGRSREMDDKAQLWRVDIRYSPFTSSLRKDRRWKAWLAERY